MKQDVQIINIALHELDQQPVQTFNKTPPADDDRTSIEVLVDDTYEQYRNALIEATPWTWARTIRPLQKDEMYDPDIGENANNPRPGMDVNVFMKSGQAIGGVLGLWSDGERSMRISTQDWSQFSSVIFVSKAYGQPWAEFNRIPDIKLIPPSFIDALVMELCARWCYSITQKEDLRAYYERKAEIALRKARRLDAQNSPSPSLGRQSPWIRARWGGLNGLGTRSRYSSVIVQPRQEN